MRTMLSGSANSENWQALFDLIPFPIYVVDVATYEVIATNDAARERTGVESGSPCYQAIYTQDRPCIFCRIAELMADAPPAVDQLIFEHFNDVDDRWYQLHESALTWFDGRPAKISIAVDISKLKEAQNELAEAHALLSIRSIELEQISVTDRLTGLFNRRKLDEVLIQEMERVGRYDQALSVAIVDVDRFKLINDQYGHQRGDLVLTSIARILQRGLRKTDILGRWGGEEFMVICPNSTLVGATAMAEHMRQMVEDFDFALAGRTTCSIGVAQLEHGESADAMIARADAALYRAKEAGRNRVEAGYSS